MIRPRLSEIREYTKTGQYDVFPVSVELLKTLGNRMTMLGVCLVHQVICSAYSDCPYRRWRNNGRNAHKESCIRCSVSSGIHIDTGGEKILHNFINITKENKKQ